MPANPHRVTDTTPADPTRTDATHDRVTDTTPADPTRTDATHDRVTDTTSPDPTRTDAPLPLTDARITDTAFTDPGLTVTPAPLVIDGLQGLRDAVGTDLGVSAWMSIEQEAIDAFALVTNDHQWIHVDPERAESGPFGAAIAHGFLTISLSNSLLWEVAVVTGVEAALNMGVNRVRFPAPVRVGTRLRMHVSLSEVKDIKGNGVETIYHLVYECEGETKPPCVADMVMRYYA